MDSFPAVGINQLHEMDSFPAFGINQLQNHGFSFDSSALIQLFGMCIFLIYYNYIQWINSKLTQNFQLSTYLQHLYSYIGDIQRIINEGIFSYYLREFSIISSNSNTIYTQGFCANPCFHTDSNKKYVKVWFLVPIFYPITFFLTLKR